MVSTNEWWRGGRICVGRGLISGGAIPDFFCRSPLKFLLVFGGLLQRDAASDG